MLSVLLPHSRQGRVLALGALLDSFATGFYLAAATLYFVDYIGISVAAVGGVIGLANLCGLLSPMPAARLTGRMGVVRVYLLLLLLRGLAFVGYSAADGYPTYLVVTCVLAAGQGHRCCRSWCACLRANRHAPGPWPRCGRSTTSATVAVS